MKLIIYGKGDFAKLVYHYVCNYTKYEVVAFCVDVDFIDGNKYLGLPLLRVDEINSVYDKHEVKLFLAVGYSSMFLREEMFRKAQKTGFEFINIVCENVMIDMSASVGVNNIFMPNVVVEPFVALGDNNVLWTGSHICHDSIIGNHNFFASGSIVGGFSKLGNRIFMGFNSVVVDNIEVFDDVLIGASSLVLKDIATPGKFFGVPARLSN